MGQIQPAPGQFAGRRLLYGSPEGRNDCGEHLGNCAGKIVRIVMEFLCMAIAGYIIMTMRKFCLVVTLLHVPPSELVPASGIDHLGQTRHRLHGFPTRQLQQDLSPKKVSNGLRF